LRSCEAIWTRSIVWPIELVRIPHDFALSAVAARLDALAALKERSLVERDTPRLLQPGSSLEPFALRALGAVREDGRLIERAAERFDLLGLGCHAEQSRRLLAAT